MTPVHCVHSKESSFFQIDFIDENWPLWIQFRFISLALLGKSDSMFDPKNGSLRIAFLTVSLYGFLLFNMYQSMIAASIAVKIFKPPIHSIEEILHAPINIYVDEGSSVHKMFLNDAEDSLYGKILSSGKLKTTTSDLHWIIETLKSKSVLNYGK